MRRAARLTALLAGIAVVVLASAYVTITSDRFERQLRSRLLAETTAAGLDLTLGDLELRPLKFGATVSGVEVNMGEGVSIHARRVGLRFALPALLRGNVALAKVVVEGAIVDLDLDRLILPKAGAGSRSPLDGAALELEQGTLRLSKGPVEAELRELSASARLERGEGRLAASFTIPRLDIAGRRLAPGRADLALRYSPTVLTLEHLRGRLRTGDIEAHGSVLLEPRELDLELTTDVGLPAISSLLNDPTLLDGDATFTGKITGTMNHPRFVGRGTLDRFAVRGEPILDGLSADVLASPSGVRLVDGHAVLDTGDPIDLRGETSFDGDAIELAYVGPRIGIPGLARRLPGLPFVDGEAQIEGEVRIPFRGKVRIDGRARVQALEPTLRVDSDDPRLRSLYGPFDGEIDLSFENNAIAVHRADLHADWGNITGDGVYHLAGSVDFCARLRATELHDLSLQDGPMPPWLERPPSLWLDGIATADMIWRGDPHDMDFVADGVATGLALLSDGDAESVACTPLGDARFELSIQGDLLTWASSVTGPVTAEASGVTELGAEGSPSHHNLAIVSDGWSARDLAALLAMPGWERWSGPIRLDAQLEGGGEWIEHIQLSGSPRFHGLQVDGLRADLTSDAAGLAVNSLEARAGAAVLTGHGRLARSPLPLEFELGVVAFDLARSFPDSPLTIGGALSARATITGQSENWRLDSTLKIVGASIGGMELGEVAATIVGDPTLVRLDLLTDADRDLWADITPRSPYPYRATASFARLALAPAWQLVSPTFPLAIGGEASGAVVATGTLAGAPPLDQVTVELSSATIDVGDYRLRMSESAHMVLSPDRILNLGTVTLEHGKETITVGGVVDMAAEATNVTVRGSADLQLLRAWYPSLVASGPVDIDVRVTRDQGGLNGSGTVALSDGYLRAPALPYPLRDIHALGRLDGRKVAVKGASARFGGGVLNADVAVDLDASRVEVAASGQDVRLTLFQDLEVRANPTIEYVVIDGRAKLSGKLEVERAIYHMRAGTTGGKLPSSELGLSGFGTTELDLRIGARSNVWLISEDVRIEGDAELHVRGTAADPSVLGSIRYLAQDKLRLDGRDYRVVRGTLSFDNPTSLDPTLDFEAQSSLQGYDVVIGISGPLSLPRVRVSSNPPLAETSVLALLGGGTADQELGVSSLSGGQEILYQLLLPRTLGGLIPRVSVSPAALRGRRDPTEVFPVTIRLPHDIDVTVGIPRREAAANLVIVDWKPFSSLTLSAIHDLDRSWGGEALIERRFGATPRLKSEATSPVSAVRIDGIDAALVATVGKDLETEPGKPLDAIAVRHDVDSLSTRLRDLGYPLAEVEPRVDEQEGRTAVRFVVELGRKIEITVAGPHPPRGLRPRLFEAVQAFGLYSETEDELERVTREAYEKDGYANGVVSCERDVTEPGAVRFHCLVEPGARVALSEIRFVGAQALSEATLRAAMGTHTSFLRRGRVITSAIESDLRGIAALYRASGFLHATARGELRPHGSHGTTLIVHIDEGPEFRVGAVELEGVSPEHLDHLRRNLTSQPGTTYRPERVAADRERILGYYGDLGHLESRASASVVERDDEALVDLTLKIEEATPVLIGEIRVLGVGRTRPGLVTSTLGLHPGDLLSYGRIAGAQRRLYDLGVFRSAQIEAVPTTTPDHRDLEVRLEETAPYRLELGGGFDNRDGLRALASISDINFTGRGRLLSLQLRASKSEGRGQFLLREPRFLGRDDWSALATAYSEWRDEVSFDSRKWVFRTEAEHPLSGDRRTRFALRYSLSKTDLKNVRVSDIDVSANERALSSVGIALVHDRRDDIIEPQHGVFASADVEWATRLVGSEQDFVKLALKGFHYQRLVPGLVWASGLQLGLGFPIDSDQLPLAERYFAGGGSSLRGLGFNQAGPRDPATGQPTGGSALVVLNQELRYNLFGPIIGSIFLDVGDVYARPRDITSDRRWSLGAGLRYRAAIVAGFDYARLLDRRPGEGADQVRFSLGYAF